MVNLAAMVWRRLLRKRWVLALVFGLSLVYFLTSTFKQEERAVRDRNLLQVQEREQPILWKVQFNLGNSSRPSNQCRNSIQGKLLITDELGYVCERKDLLVNGCCNINVPGTKQYCCDGCLSNGCCSAYEHCVSCCLQPNKQLLLERFLNRAAVAFQNLFMAVEDHFELCLAKCRTSSQVALRRDHWRCEQIARLGFSLPLPLYIWKLWVASFMQREVLMLVLLMKTQGLEGREKPSPCSSTQNHVNFVLDAPGSSKALAEFLLNSLN